MAEAYALHEGAFGRVVVLELRGDLVAHAHAETQFAFWLGGGRAHANLGNGQVVHYSEDVALGTNAYESHDADGQWWRSYGNENWEFDEHGLMRRRHASINDLPIGDAERLFHWDLDGPRPDDHPGLDELGL